MTPERLEVLKKMEFTRLSSHDITFEGVRVKLNNKRIRRGSYEFLVQLQYPDADDEMEIRTLEMRFAFQPYRSEYFIHHTFDAKGDSNSAATLTDYIFNLPIQQRSHIKDSNQLKESRFAEIKAMVFAVLQNRHLWELNRGGQTTYDNGKGRWFIRELGYID